MLPTVFRRARGWISACDRTVVWARNRSTSERTNGRIAADLRRIATTDELQNMVNVLRQAIRLSADPQ